MPSSKYTSYYSIGENVYVDEDQGARSRLSLLVAEAEGADTATAIAEALNAAGRPKKASVEAMLATLEQITGRLRAILGFGGDIRPSPVEIRDDLSPVEIRDDLQVLEAVRFLARATRWPLALANLDAQIDRLRRIDRAKSETATEQEVPMPEPAAPYGGPLRSPRS